MPMKIKQEVDAITSRSARKMPQPRATKPSSGSSLANNCYRCGEPFSRGHQQVCRAKDAICDWSHKTGHYAIVCSKTVQSVTETIETARDEGPLIIDDIIIGSTSCEPTDVFSTTKLLLQGLRTPLTFKLDTGSAMNAILAKIISSITPKPQVNPTKKVLQAYGGHPIPTLGTIILPCKHASQQLSLEFFVIDQPVTPILGLKACLATRAVSIQSVVNWHHPSTVDLPEQLARFSPIFNGLGKMNGSVSIQTRPEIPPVVRLASRLAFTVEPRVTAELKRMKAWA